MNTNQSIKDILAHQWQGTTYNALDGQRKQSIDQALAAINRIIAAERKDEIQTMHKGFKAGLKHQSAEYKYVMQPIMRSIERRIDELDHLTKEGTQ